MFVDIQLRHSVLKPSAIRTSRRYGHYMDQWMHACATLDLGCLLSVCVNPGIFTK